MAADDALHPPPFGFTDVEHERANRVRSGQCQSTDVVVRHRSDSPEQLMVHLVHPGEIEAEPGGYAGSRNQLMLDWIHENAPRKFNGGRKGSDAAAAMHSISTRCSHRRPGPPAPGLEPAPDAPRGGGLV